jgi:hypothetical protein
LGYKQLFQSLTDLGNRTEQKYKRLLGIYKEERGCYWWGKKEGEKGVTDRKGKL